MPFSIPSISAKGIEMELVPERLWGEVAKFDIVSAPDGKVLVDKRITA